MGSLAFDTIPDIPCAGMARVNPLLSALAQRENDSDLLTVLRAAREEGMEIVMGGRLSNLESPPDPTLPFSVMWFDRDMPEYGRIGVGSTSVNHPNSSSIVINTEESWTIRSAEDVEDPCVEPSLMRWDDESGWFNDHVIYLVEARPYRFLINWCTTGFRPAERSTDGHPQVDARTRCDP